MVVLPDGREHMLTPEEGALYAQRLQDFLRFAGTLRTSV